MKFDPRLPRVSPQRRERERDPGERNETTGRAGGGVRGTHGEVARPLPGIVQGCTERVPRQRTNGRLDQAEHTGTSPGWHRPGLHQRGGGKGTCPLATNERTTGRGWGKGNIDVGPRTDPQRTPNDGSIGAQGPPTGPHRLSGPAGGPTRRSQCLTLQLERADGIARATRRRQAGERTKGPNGDCGERAGELVAG